MQARGKRITAYFDGVFIVAGLFGLLFGSWPLFLICFAILILLTWVEDAIRAR